MKELAESGNPTLDSLHRFARAAENPALDTSVLSGSEAFAFFCRYVLLAAAAGGQVIEWPDRADVRTFNLQANEVLLAVIPQISYYESKTRVSYVGGSSGASIRIARGLWLRSSSYRGQRVERESIELRDTGTVGFTTKHIYFAGKVTSFRTAYDRIVSYAPYEDGLSFHRAAASARPQFLMVPDSWFFASLGQTLVQRDGDWECIDTPLLLRAVAALANPIHQATSRKARLWVRSARRSPSPWRARLILAVIALLVGMAVLQS
jgi:hypothetical protein